MRKGFVVVLLLTASVNLFSQLSIQQAEEKILKWHNQSTQLISDSLKKKYNDSIALELTSILALPNSFEYSFLRLKKIGFIYSPDSAFRMINWNYFDAIGNSQYYLIIQSKPIGNKNCLIHSFQCNQRLKMGQSEFIKYNMNNWYGALYYTIIPRELNQHKYYLILGFCFNTIMTNQKVIETFYFDENTIPIMGMPVFAGHDKLYNRIVFEFKDEITMMLRYDEQERNIVFDHLAPNNSMNTGIYEFYGPDGTYDGLTYDGFLWKFISKITLKNNQSAKQNIPIKRFVPKGK